MDLRDLSELFEKSDEPLILPWNGRERNDKGEDFELAPPQKAMIYDIEEELDLPVLIVDENDDEWNVKAETLSAGALSC